VTTIFDVVEPWSVYIFGPPGCGKTTLAALAPNPGFIMVDRNGHRALRRLGNDYSNIPMLRTRTWNEFEDGCKRLKMKWAEHWESLETIIVDTFSRAQQLSNKQQLKSLGAGRKDLSENEFRITNSRMEDMMSVLQDYGKNTVFLAHQREDKDDAGSTILFRPANSEGTMGNVIAQTDGVFYMTAIGRENGSAERRLRTMSTPLILAKSRFAETLPHEIKNPDQEFWKLLEVA
jgi:adenylate kinase family enzyme